uniref:Kinesin motor domain-containing protein n=1 Tax=Sus scrofa TaxID=9823 RepID=A0A8D1T7F4_PIG
MAGCLPCLSSRSQPEAPSEEIRLGGDSALIFEPHERLHQPTHRLSQIYSIDEDEKLAPSLEIILPRDLADGFVNNKRESYRFKFQRIFDQDAKQETIFENIAKPVAER